MTHTGIIALEGLPVVAAFAAIAAVFWVLGWYKAAVLMTALSIFSIWFFRNPERHAPAGERLAVAPADGKVIFVGEVDETRYLNAKAVKVSIFMNVFNVHVNRAPESGTVKEIHYNPGKFVSANLDKASLDNEQNAVIMDCDGRRVMFVQIAGLIARRIVCWVKTGDSLERGERFGLIMFGSRVDIYMPPGTDVRVKPGDKTKSGETILGVMP